MVSCLSHWYGGMAKNGNCRANLERGLNVGDEALWAERLG